MTTEPNENNTLSKKNAPRRKSWIYILFALLLAVGFGYYGLINQTSASIDHDFYRVLYEASNKFNENFNSLNSMHNTGESEVSIRSLFPSYNSTNDKKANTKSEKETYSYVLMGQKIQIMSTSTKEKESVPLLDASIELKDLLPSTSTSATKLPMIVLLHCQMVVHTLLISTSVSTT